MQASLYKVGLEVAMQPAALRSDGLPASFTVRGMTTGTTFYWMGSQPLLTKEHLTEFRVVAPPRPLGQAQLSWMKLYRFITLPHPICKGWSCDQ